MLAGRSPSSQPIFTYLGERNPVRCHEHIAIVHRGRGKAVQGVDFLGEGLRHGHRCCCRTPSARRAALLAGLGKLGVDVQRHQDNQTLQFPPEAADSNALLDWAKGFFADAEAARAPAVRWLEVGIEKNRAGVSAGQFFELHARLNYLIKQYPGAILCDYDTDKLEVPLLFSAIAVHRHLLVDGTLVRDNPFYIPAEKFLAMPPEERERDLREVFRAVGFDLRRLLATLAGYGRLQHPAPGLGS